MKQILMCFLCPTTAKMQHQLLFFAAFIFAVGFSAAQLEIAQPSTLTDYSASSYDDESPMPYIYGYSVIDGQSNSNFDHHETSDAKVITGSYRVALPDGRTQIVTYTADENGYVADVKYEGDAKYPEHRKYFNQPVTTN